MKVIASLVATTFAQQTVPNPNPFPANEEAPHCGCQIILEDQEYINKTCSLNFIYPTKYGGPGSDPHFVSVASTFMVGREKDADSGSKFIFTGYDDVSNPDVLDILVFYEQNQCFKTGRPLPANFSAVPQSERWEYYAMDDEQLNDLCKYELVCDDSGFVPGVHLGNFNYDIARSVQTYTVPIYGLEKGQTAQFTLKDYNDDDNNCMNALAHEGHGIAGGCSSNFTGTPADCSNVITFSHELDHNGLLEYFQFEPISPDNNKQCWAAPLHHIDNYQWQTPSPWDTQQAGVTIF